MARKKAQEPIGEETKILFLGLIKVVHRSPEKMKSLGEALTSSPDEDLRLLGPCFIEHGNRMETWPMFAPRPPEGGRGRPRRSVAKEGRDLAVEKMYRIRIEAAHEAFKAILDGELPEEAAGHLRPLLPKTAGDKVASLLISAERQREELQAMKKKAHSPKQWGAWVYLAATGQSTSMKAAVKLVASLEKHPG